ncbi:hypothetical protein FQR65_LT17240 [Abscondita terminalis]|nr:hypothetical protein FQR65_LT17240 [Abscondita terminalis]
MAACRRVQEDLFALAHDLVRFGCPGNEAAEGGWKAGGSAAVAGRRWRRDRRVPARRGSGVRARGHCLAPWALACAPSCFGDLGQAGVNKRPTASISASPPADGHGGIQAPSGPGGRWPWRQARNCAARASQAPVSRARRGPGRWRPADRGSAARAAKRNSGRPPRAAPIQGSGGGLHDGTDAHAVGHRIELFGQVLAPKPASRGKPADGLPSPLAPWQVTRKAGAPLTPCALIRAPSSDAPSVQAGAASKAA